jgi:hypothetical protein
MNVGGIVGGALGATAALGLAVGGATYFAREDVNSDCSKSEEPSSCELAGFILAPIATVGTIAASFTAGMSLGGLTGLIVGRSGNAAGSGASVGAMAGLASIVIGPATYYTAKHFFEK